MRDDPRAPSSVDMDTSHIAGAIVSDPGVGDGNYQDYVLVYGGEGWNLCACARFIQALTRVTGTYGLTVNKDEEDGL